MQYHLSRNFRFIILLSSIYLLAWFIQNTVLFNSDVSWLLFVTKRLLSGGTYTKDFFEINPPMILYLYSPVILIKKILPINVIVLFKNYIFLLSALSLYLCNQLLSRLIAPEDNWVISTLIATIAFVFLIMPLGDFGQREHLLVILSMPYFLLLAYRLVIGDHLSQNDFLWMTFFIGIIAGIAFSIKPYFLASFILVEIYYLIKIRNMFAWYRPECIAVMCVMFTYAILLLLLHHDYLFIVLPSVNQFYYQDVAARTTTVLFSASACIFYFSGLFYFLRINQSDYQPLITIIFLAAVGFFIAYGMQRTIWYYHVLPMFSYSFVLLTLLFVLMLNQSVTSLNEYMKLGVFSLLVLCYIMFHTGYIWISVLYYPYAYFGVFLFVFTIVLFRAGRNINKYKILGSLCFIFSFNFFLYCYLQHSIYNQHIFLLTTVVLILMLVLFVPVDSEKLKYGFFSVCGVVMLSSAFFQVGYVYDSLLAYNKLLTPLISTMKKIPGDKVYFFSDSGEFAFPAVNYTGQTFTSRFGCLTWVPLFYDVQNKDEYSANYLKNKNQMDVYVNDIADDITRYQPDLIYVDTRAKGYIGIVQPDYLRFFLLNKQFKGIWKSYAYLRTIQNKPLFRFDIYRRI